MGLACVPQHRVLTGQAVGRSGASPCEGRMTPNNFPGAQGEGPSSLGGLSFPFCDVPLPEGLAVEGRRAPRLKGAPVNPGT